MGVKVKEVLGSDWGALFKFRVRIRCWRSVWRTRNQAKINGEEFV